jgi:glycosyltransferase involved in cell wall biosynthesis
MLGWEYPPHVTGGLAAATAGVVGGLLAQGVRVILLLPAASGVEVREGLRVIEVLGEHPNAPYAERHVAGEMFDAVERFAERAPAAASGLAFDVIHAHEWLTARPAADIAAASGRPWVFHVHATEFDRAGPHGNPHVLAVEGRAAREADLVIAVSEYTRRMLIEHYGADPARVVVVHNSVQRTAGYAPPAGGFARRRPLVLFLGRLTFQKGPDYFVEAAARVAERRPDLLFVVAGDGEMRSRLIRRVAELGLGRQVLFTGFVSSDDARRLFARADLYVMPSVSEPFGISALEALDAGVPIIVSRGAGVREVVRDALEVDFWDVDALAAQILAALAYPVLRRELAGRGRAALDRWTWNDAGARIAGLYGRLLRRSA